VVVLEVLSWTVWNLGGRRTCHTKGRFLRFVSASRIAAILHKPPGLLKPIHFTSVSTRLVRREGCAARAAIEAPATMMLIACAIVTMPM
jgi:hypothetical protein